MTVWHDTVCPPPPPTDVCRYSSKSGAKHLWRCRHISMDLYGFSAWIWLLSPTSSSTFLLKRRRKCRRRAANSRFNVQILFSSVSVEKLVQCDPFWFGWLNDTPENTKLKPIWRRVRVLRRHVCLLPKWFFGGGTKFSWRHPVTDVKLKLLWSNQVA
jgi:hypothetical protein